MTRATILTTTLTLLASSASAFTVPQPSMLAATTSTTTMPTTTVALLDGLKGPAKAYADIWTPWFKDYYDNGNGLPEALLHWGHAGAMTSVLLSMGLIGAAMGWQIRFGAGNESNALTLGETVREAHPKIMGGAAFFFLLGGQGGLVLKQTLEAGNVLESPHAVTGILALTLLAFQVVLPRFFAKGGQLARDVHTFVGTSTMALLFAHMATGIQLGLSI